MNYLLSILLLLAQLLYGQNGLAHELTMTTAQVTLRQTNHLSIRIETDLSDLAANLMWSNKPPSLIHLSTADDNQIEAFRQALLTLFSKMPITVDNLPLQSQKARVTDRNSLRTQLQTAVAEQLLAKQHSHDYATRDNYLVIDVDGFVPSYSPKSTLYIGFPVTLGPLSISYSRPKAQTLTAGDKITEYRQILE